MSIFDHLKKAAQGAAAEALRTGESRTFHFKAARKHGGDESTAGSGAHLAV